MCLQDLQLGRGRYIGKQLVIDNGAAVSIPANPQRVALFVQVRGSFTFDSAGGPVQNDIASLYYGDDTAGQMFAQIQPLTPPSVLRVEDLGNLITGPLTFSMFSLNGQGLLFITEILTNVASHPIFTLGDLR